ncbi:MAG: hypothetical protein JWN76_367 [Chitinophagaceae bacterium]|nr:hypothetical protein [Chitinophagaceae bacterium]
MKHVFKIAKPLLLVLLLISAVAAFAWQSSQSSKSKKDKRDFSPNGDTSRPGKSIRGEDDYRVGDLDKALKELDEGMRKMKIQLKEIDFENINRQVKESMAKIDFDKITRDADDAINKVDWKKIDAEIKTAMKEAQSEIARVDMVKLKKDMEGLKEKMKSEQFKMALDTVRLNKTIRESMDKARVSLDRAKEEIKHLKSLVDVLDKDGLINKKKAFKLELKEGDLYINDVKQSKETTSKYKEYYWKDHFSIRSDGQDSMYL